MYGTIKDDFQKDIEAIKAAVDYKSHFLHAVLLLLETVKQP